jgi:hypothetical protein
MIGYAFGALVALAVVLMVVLWVVFAPSRDAPSPAAIAAAASPDLGPPPRPLFDQLYLKALGAEVRMGSQEGAISVGRRVCGALDEGRTPQEVRTILFEKGFTDVEAGRIMLASVRAYCPDKASIVNG